MALNPIEAAKAMGKNIGDAAKAAGKNVREVADTTGEIMKQATEALLRVQNDVAKAREGAKETLSAEQYRGCKKIIGQSATEASVAGGVLVGLPTIDNFIIGSRGTKMIASLSKVFGLEYAEAASVAILERLATSTLGWTVDTKGFMQIFVDRIPVIGNAHNAVAAGAITELLGWKSTLDFCHSVSQSGQDQELPEVTRDTLIQQAEEFLNGAKNYEKDKTEYKHLLNKMDTYACSHEDEYDQEFENVYRKLTDLGR